MTEIPRVAMFPRRKATLSCLRGLLLATSLVLRQSPAWLAPGWIIWGFWGYNFGYDQHRL